MENKWNLWSQAEQEICVVCVFTMYCNACRVWSALYSCVNFTVNSVKCERNSCSSNIGRKFDFKGLKERIPHTGDTESLNVCGH